MKLLRCYIGDYRVLRRLGIQFTPSLVDDGDIAIGSTAAESMALDFLVGPNGCGKSTVLIAIAEIVRRLEAALPVPFPFELEYDLATEGGGQRRIRVSNRAPDESEIEEPVPLRVTVDGRAEEFSRLLLPTIIAFTTGAEEEWHRPIDSTFEDGFQQTASQNPAQVELEDLWLREVPGSIVAAIEPEAPPADSDRVFLVRSEYLPLVMLCGYLAALQYSTDGRPGDLSKVLEESNIRRLSGFSLRFRLNEGIATDAERKEIAQLASIATRAVRLGSDRLLVFDLTQRAQALATQFLEHMGGSFECYLRLARMTRRPAQAENVLQEVNLFLERGSKENRQAVQEVSPIHLFSWLSDGEQSFLGRMSLFSMLRGRESLILLDEPEVHFNDYWKRQIISLLDQMLKGQSSHALITTHSSITLTDVPSDDIIVLHRGETRTEDSGRPSIPTLAADPSDIMVHVFQAPYATGQRAVDLVLRTLEQVGQLTGESHRQQLEELRDQVGPGYWSYRIRRALQRV